MVSISQSPNRVPSASLGRSCMLVRGYIGRFCRTQDFASLFVFEPMRHMQSQFPGRIGMDMVVDGLLGDVDTFFPEYSRYLGGRPFLLFDHALNSPP